MTGAVMEHDNTEALQQRLREIEAELGKRNEYVSRLEKANRELERRVKEANEAPQQTADLSQIEETLKRLVARIAMILQAEKCLFMIHDPDNKELFGENPALGLDPEQVKKIRISADKGISGTVLGQSEPYILYDALTDEKAQQEKLAELGVRNGVTVPLIVETRDEETNKVLDRKTIGVLHVFNKRYGNIFMQEDVQLLERLARNAAAVINSAETFRRVVEEKEELVDTLEALYAGLVLINRNGRIAQINASARDIFGLSPEDLIGGKTYDQIVQDEELREVLRKALEQETGVQEEIVIANPRLPEQQHTFQVQSAQVRNESGEVIGTAAIFNDITQLKNVDKMKTAFVSTVSHELRTPLTSIKGFTSTLLMDDDGTMFDEESRREFYTIIDTECDRLRRLIDDLLNVSRIESGKAVAMNINEFNLGDVLKKVVTVQNGSTYKKPSHTISWELSPEMPKLVSADQDKVEQIFHNLIGNALKYAPEGGPVTVTGKMMPGGELMEFAITDKGIGMSKDFLKKAGERFARADNRDTRTIGGTGIGLFLVKAFIEQHGGKMWPHSEGEGKGSTFFFTLPITQPEDSDDSGFGGRVAG